jgi:hypothetical protein
MTQAFTQLISDGSCKRSTPKSRSTCQRQARKNFAVHVSLSVFTCQTANRTQNDIPSPPTYQSAKTPSVPMKRSRAAPPAAAPSRWPLYRSTQLRLSTTQMKVFRQKWISIRKPRIFNSLALIRQMDGANQTGFSRITAPIALLLKGPLGTTSRSGLARRPHC